MPSTTTAGAGRDLALDYEIHRAARHCAATGRELAEGETFYSALLSDANSWKRLDFAAEAWRGPPENALGWWRSRMPSRESKKARLAPNDVLLEYFQELNGRSDELDALYVLALLLVRRRVFRLEESETDAAGNNVLTLYCPRDESTVRVSERYLSDEQTTAIQARLTQLLYAESN